MHKDIGKIGSNINEAELIYVSFIIQQEREHDVNCVCFPLPMVTVRAGQGADEKEFNVPVSAAHIFFWGELQRELDAHKDANYGDLPIGAQRAVKNMAELAGLAYIPNQSRGKKPHFCSSEFFWAMILEPGGLVEKALKKKCEEYKKCKFFENIYKLAEDHIDGMINIFVHEAATREKFVLCSGEREALEELVKDDSIFQNCIKHIGKRSFTKSLYLAITNPEISAAGKKSRDRILDFWRKSSLICGARGLLNRNFRSERNRFFFNELAQGEKGLVDDEPSAALRWCMGSLLTSSRIVENIRIIMMKKEKNNAEQVKKLKDINNDQKQENKNIQNENKQVHTVLSALAGENNNEDIENNANNNNEKDINLVQIKKSAQ